MTSTKDHDALEGKKRFVQSLTHSRRYLNDAHFLIPTSKTAVSDASQHPSARNDPAVDETETSKNTKHQNSKVYY
jgi:hypothetical protein